MKYLYYEVEVKSTIKNGTIVTGKGIYEVESISFEVDPIKKLGDPLEKSRRVSKIRIYNKSRTSLKTIYRKDFSKLNYVQKYMILGIKLMKLVTFFECLDSLKRNISVINVKKELYLYKKVFII